MPKFAIALMVMIAAMPVRAAVHVWTGATSHLFSDASNWRGGSPAGDPQAELSFPPGATRLAITNDLPALTIRSLSITGSGYTIGGMSLTLASDADVTDSSPGLNTIECDLHLAGGAIFRSEADFGEHELIISGAINGVGPVTKLGDRRVTFAGTQPNPYSGETRVLRGELRLAKTDGVQAIGGDLLVDDTVTTIAHEQIPDSATLRIAGRLRSGTTETLGPLVLDEGAEISGRMILSGDVTIRRGFDDVMLKGEIALAGTRTFTSCAECAPAQLFNVRDHTPGSGLILRGGEFDIRGSSYRGPTVIEGAQANVFNPNTSVRLRGGTFSGHVASLLVEEGIVDAGDTDGVHTEGDLKLSPATTVLLGFHESSSLRFSSNGALDLGSAKLFIESWPDPRLLGRTHLIGEKTSPARSAERSADCRKVRSLTASSASRMRGTTGTISCSPKPDVTTRRWTSPPIPITAPRARR